MHCFSLPASTDVCHDDVPAWLKAVVDSASDADTEEASTAAASSGADGPAADFAGSSSGASDDGSAAEAAAPVAVSWRTALAPCPWDAALLPCASSCPWAGAPAAAAAWPSGPHLGLVPPVPTAAVARSQVRQPLPEEGLIDIDEAEGRRRGNLLMSLLHPRAQQQQQQQQAPEASKGGSCPGPCGRGLLLPSAVPFVPRAVAAAARGESASPAPRRELFAGERSAAICEAVCRTFGGDTATVHMESPTDFQIKVAAKRLQVWESPQAALEALGRALWPLFGPDVLAMEPMEVPNRAWLAVRCLAAGAVGQGDSHCWDFMQHGTCPRGTRCRWPHIAVGTYTVDVELLASY